MARKKVVVSVDPNKLTVRETQARLEKLQGQGWPGSVSIHRKAIARKVSDIDTSTA